MQFQILSNVDFQSMGNKPVLKYGSPFALKCSVIADASQDHSVLVLNMIEPGQRFGHDMIAMVLFPIVAVAMILISRLFSSHFFFFSGCAILSQPSSTIYSSFFVIRPNKLRCVFGSDSGIFRSFFFRTTLSQLLKFRFTQLISMFLSMNVHMSKTTFFVFKSTCLYFQFFLLSDLLRLNFQPLLIDY